MKIYKLNVDHINGPDITKTVKLNNGNLFVDTRSNKYKIDLNAITLRNDFADYVVYSLLSDGGVVSLLAETFPSRKASRDYFFRVQRTSLLHIVFPVKANLDLAYVVVICENNGTIEFDGLEDSGDVNSSLQFLPTLSITPVANINNIAEFRIESSIKEDAQAYISATTGALLTPQVKLVKGVGKAYISFNGLPTGTDGKLKAGFKFYSNIASIEYTVQDIWHSLI